MVIGSISACFKIILNWVPRCNIWSLWWVNRKTGLHFLQAPSHPPYCLDWLHLYLSSLTAFHHLSMLLCSHITYSPVGGSVQFLDPWLRAVLSFLLYNISLCCHTYYSGLIMWYFIDPQGEFLFLLAPPHSEVRLSYCTKHQPWCWWGFSIWLKGMMARWILVKIKA